MSPITQQAVDNLVSHSMKKMSQNFLNGIKPTFFYLSGILKGCSSPQIAYKTKPGPSSPLVLIIQAKAQVVREGRESERSPSEWQNHREAKNESKQEENRGKKESEEFLLSFWVGKSNFKPLLTLSLIKQFIFFFFNF